jgi:hypothetical protein
MLIKETGTGNLSASVGAAADITRCSSPIAPLAAIKDAPRPRCLEIHHRNVLETGVFSTCNHKSSSNCTSKWTPEFAVITRNIGSKSMYPCTRQIMAGQ